MGLYADELAAKTMSDEEVRPTLAGQGVPVSAGPLLSRRTAVQGQYGARSPAGRPRVRSSRSPGPPRNRYRSMSRSRSRSPGDNNSTVFVGNLNHDTDDRAMREFFTQYGKVLETKVGDASRCPDLQRRRARIVAVMLICTAIADHLQHRDRQAQRLWLCEIRGSQGCRRCHPQR